MNEARFQSELIEELEEKFPGCIVIRLDPRFVDFYIDGDKFSQGVLDLLIMFGGRVGTLECKASLDARYQPNQEYFIERFDHVAFAARICPENKGEVLHDLERALRPRKQARVS